MLDRASKQLFNRSPDEYCESLEEMAERSLYRKQSSYDRWENPSEIHTAAEGDGLFLNAGTDGYWLNAWSFGQLCKIAGVAVDTVNKLQPDTANRVFRDTLPRGGAKPIQLFIEENIVRSVHGTQYTRLWDAELVGVVQEFDCFQPPQKGFNGATGLYLGEQDMFCFLIDPTCWVDIDGEAFAPGFFVWNSEVGRRSIGVETFWFQAVCQNHIVWGEREVETFSRKHTASVKESLSEIRRIIDVLYQKRNERKDGFASVIKKAMAASIENEEALQLLNKRGIGKKISKRAIEIAQQKGALSIFSIVDALTMIAREQQCAGDRTDADQKAGKLLLEV